jgi:hypothetical protein
MDILSVIGDRNVYDKYRKTEGEKIGKSGGKKIAYRVVLFILLNIESLGPTW